MPSQKTILFLGAAKFQTPIIIAAKEKGHRVITCDNVPFNPGHRIADKTYPISTLEKEKVLECAKSEKVDAVLTFGSDVSAPTTAWVCEKLQLSGLRYSTSEILTNKFMFRQFLKEQDLQKSLCKTFHQSELQQAIHFVTEHQTKSWIVKPLNRSGSKGVSILHPNKDPSHSIQEAIHYDFQNACIIEEFIHQKGPQICGDGWMENNQLKYVCYGDGWFNEASLVPYAETFPSQHNPSTLTKVSQKIEKVLQAANYNTGPFNLDVIIQQDDEPFIIELGPRCGGNYIPSAIRYYSHVDLISGALELSLDSNYSLPCDELEQKFPHASYIIHSEHSGTLQAINIDEVWKAHMIENNPYKELNSPVEPFNSGSDAIGNMLLKFDRHEQMLELIQHHKDYIHIQLK